MSLPELCLGLAPLVFLLRCPGEPRWHIHAAQGHSRGMPSQGNLPGWLRGTGAGEGMQGKSSSCSDSPSGGILEPCYFIL